MSDWNTPYLVSEQQRRTYQEDGCLTVRGALDPEWVSGMAPVLSQSVARRRASQVDKPLHERSVYEQAFLQTMNLWEDDPAVHAMVFSRRLASIAAGLLGCERVRLYHDQALFKEPGGGYTPWHADQHYWPLADDRAITVWIPLQDVDPSMGPLAFSLGSQHLMAHRELAISEESERLIGEHLTLKDLPTRCEPYQLGDVSFHGGWTFHRAGGNDSPRMRAVMTMIYIAEDMRLKTLPRQRDEAARFCPGVVDGAIIDGPLNPVIG